jgi:Flp pilus assembly pilin Flp
MREWIVRTLHALHHDEAGQDLTEYALVAALIAFAGIMAMHQLATGINRAFSKVGSQFGNAV